MRQISLLCLAVAILITSTGTLLAAAKNKPQPSAFNKVQGDSFIAVYKNLTLSPKSEFETEQSYKDRLDGVINSGRTFRFTTKRTNGNFGYIYDAERQFLFVESGIGPLLKSYYKESTKSDTIIYLGSDGKTVGSYYGSNAFGYTTKVFKEKNQYYALIVTNYDEILSKMKPIDNPHPVGKVEKLAGFAFEDISPVEAEKIARRFQLVYVCSPSYNGVGTIAFSNNENSLPKVNDPFETTSEYMFIKVRVRAIQLYDASTGTLLREALID